MIPASKLRLLLVDDDVISRDRLARALHNRGFDVATAGDYAEGLESASARVPDRAVVDLRMPGRSGLELIAALLELHPEMDVVVLTGYGSIATAIEAIRLGARNYLQKPADADDVLAAFAKAAEPPLKPSPVIYQAPSLARAEWEHIQRVLADVAGNISQAARRLGMPRRSLQRKLQKYPPLK
jgi:two-component system response regulator RegA